jgi:hypothetical protein
VHRRHPRHYFERDARRGQHFGLFATAAKHEGIAAFETHHAFPFEGLG